MTKETFVRQKVELNGKIDELRQVINKLKAEYIEANKPFNLGDKVKVIKGKSVEFGVVTGFEIRYSNSVECVLNKLKKDGTQSQIKLYVWGAEKIELS